jgi:protein CrcB
VSPWGQSLRREPRLPLRVSRWQTDGDGIAHAERLEARHRRTVSALGPRFPWGTFTVNLVGCLLFGVVFALTEGRVRHVAEVRLFGLPGFMGAFTTFSTFAFDTVQLGESSRVAALVANLAMQNAWGCCSV